MLPYIDWYQLEILLSRFVSFRGNSNKYKPLSTEELFEMMRIIDQISNQTQYLIFRKGKIIDLQAILQWIRNMNTYFSYNKFYTDGITETQSLIFRNRDLQMTENIIWITENFPKEKFSVWCANFHGAKDISQTQYPADSLLYFVFQSMGEGVADKLENKVYSLAITSLNDDSGKKEKEKGILEQNIALSTNNAPFAYIDFEPLRFAKGFLDKEFNCNVIMKKNGKWLYIYDGLYYVRDQQKKNH